MNNKSGHQPPVEPVVTVARATITDLVSLMDELNALTERLRTEVKQAEDDSDE